MKKHTTYQQVTTGIKYSIGDLYGYPDSLIRSRTGAAYNYAVDSLIIEKHSSILDFGSGRGHGLKVIKAKLKPARLTSIDKESSYIHIAQLPLHSDDNIEFIVSDRLLALKSNSFDAIFCMHVLEHLPNPEVILSDFKRVLKNNGRLIVATPDRGHLVGNSQHDEYIYNDSELEMLLKKACFRNLKISYINADKKAWKFHRRKHWLGEKCPWTVRLRDYIPSLWEILVLRLGLSITPLTAADFYLSDEYSETTLDLLAIVSK